jgi:DedD protein
MDRGLKERLIGAVVLVAIGAWLIPWVLDGPPQFDEIEPASLELPVPDEPLPLRTQTIHLDDRGSSTRDATPDTQPRRPVPAGTGADLRQAATPTTSRQDVSGQTSDDGPTAGASSPAQSASSATPAPAEQEAAAASRSEPAEQAEPSAADSPAAAAIAASGTWLVQLGSFGEEQNARRLADRVATHGYTPSITNVRAGGRLMHRVRVGPYETRDGAEQAASTLSARGFVAQVVGAD